MILMLREIMYIDSSFIIDVDIIVIQLFVDILLIYYLYCANSSKNDYF